MALIGFLAGLVITTASAATATSASDGCEPFGESSIYQRWTMQPAWLRAQSRYDQLCREWTRLPEGQKPAFWKFVKTNEFGDQNFNLLISLDGLSAPDRNQYVKIMLLAERVRSDAGLIDRLAEFKRINDGYNIPVIEFGYEFSFTLIHGIKLKLSAGTDHMAWALSAALDAYNSIIKGMKTGNAELRARRLEIDLLCNTDEAIAHDWSGFRAALDDSQASCASAVPKILSAATDARVADHLRARGIRAIFIDRVMQGPDKRPVVWIKSTSAGEDIKSFLGSI